MVPFLLSGAVMHRYLLFFGVILMGCSRSHGTLDLEPDSGSSGVTTDAASPDDVRPPDIEPEPSPMGLLGRVLSCSLSLDEALPAAVRLAACDADLGGHESASWVMETWEVGLASRLEANVSGYPFTCERMRCAADASSCDDYDACLSTIRIPGPCEPYGVSCAGDVITHCDPEGTSRERTLDCAVLGGTCEEGRCHRGECTFGMDYYALTCSEDEPGTLVLCDDLRVDCAAATPGGVCQSVAVGGEAPSDWCAPPGAERYGLYGMPIECDGGAIEFDSFSGRSFRYDCIANGYSGCGERGCVP
jgi:hypothetical protein